MKRWLYVALAFPVVVWAGLFVCGLISFTPLGGLVGQRWHYEGGLGLGKLAPLPNQSAILYSSSRTGTSHIYSVVWNGHTSRQLTNDSRDDSDVAVSPSGRQIAFVRQDAQEMITHVWLMNANGMGQHQITFGADSQMEPCFSPNGRQIAYTNATRSSCQIWLMSATGTNQAQLTGGDIDTSPAFDAAGAAIYFRRQAADTANPALQIWIVGTSGKGEKFLGSGDHPTVSPNGRQIAFYDEQQNQTVGIMNANGTGRQIVRNYPGAGGVYLAFCPNGDLLNDRPSSQPGKDDFMTMNPNTGRVQTVATVDE